MNLRHRIVKQLTVLGISAALLYTGTAAYLAPPAEAAVSTRDRVITIGKKYLGTPYQFGAKYGSTSRFDCSSFTKWVYHYVGKPLPRASKDQAKVGRYVPRSKLIKGDLVFFTTTSRPGISHVAIYIGNNKILHTYGAGGVKISSMASGWWDNHYVTARRVL
ncbi:C40 family peptidase [Paenibacillus gansuensis]|uniref:C40 family peptidase n=1 Tax=Paenibacillus gansuensis TaxID=306542 RepID=A0ABW5PGJ5_9BACL